MKLPAVWLCSAAGIIDVQLGYSSNSSSKIQTQFTMIKKKKKFLFFLEVLLQWFPDRFLASGFNLPLLLSGKTND
jgi:hypothetical protein